MSPESTAQNCRGNKQGVKWTEVRTVMSSPGMPLRAGDVVGGVQAGENLEPAGEI